MALRLNGSSSGYVELDVPAAAGSHTLTLPDGGGSSGQYLQTNGSGGLSWATISSASNLTRLTAVTPTGSSVDYTNLPSGIRKLYVVMSGLKPNGSGGFMVQIGDSGGLETTGYTSVGICHYAPGGLVEQRRSDSFAVFSDGALYRQNTIMLIANITGNKWVSSHNGFMSDNASYPYVTNHGAGRKELSGELTQLRITLSTGNFDAGDVNLFYEV